MPLRIFVSKEIVDGESRVALTPDSVKRLLSKGFKITVSKGAGENAFYSDKEYREAGAKLAQSSQEISKANIVLKVRPPIFSKSKKNEAEQYKKNSFVISFQDIQNNQNNLKVYAKNQINAMAVEWVPRTTLAQSMDVLSSMATVVGYRSVLIGAEQYQSFFPMFMTAAGTITPAKVLIIGAGVAGLQAIATAKRLGAQVEAFDTRPAVKEQVMSLGAKFVEMELPKDSQDKQGYAKEMSKEFIKKELEVIERHLIKANLCISTAQVFGKKAPLLILKKMLNKMKPGSVIVDLAVEQGGNCELSQLGRIVEYNGVRVVGPNNIASQMATDSSKMFSKNIENLLVHVFREGNLDIDTTDEIVERILVTRNGKAIKKEF